MLLGALCLGAVLAWYLVILPALNILVIVASIIPAGFGIASMYLVATVSPERFPEVGPAAYPALAFILCCFAVRTLVFLRGHGRKGLIFIALYFALAVLVGLVLTYAKLRPFGFDATSAATGVPAFIEGRMLALEYVTFGKLPSLLSAYKGFTEFAFNLDSDLLAVSYVVYWFMLPIDPVLAIIVWVKFVSRREAAMRKQLSTDQQEVVEQ